MDGNADCRGTSAVFQTVIMFYAVCSICPVVFDQIKSGFLLRPREWYLAGILSLLPFSRINVEFMLKSGVLGE
jgi:glycopeptide antibiotics resistance protein